MRSLIGCHAVGVEELVAPVAPVVAAQRPFRNRQVGPTVGDTEFAEVDVPATAALVVDQGVGAQASPWHTTGPVDSSGWSVTQAGGTERTVVDGGVVHRAKAGRRSLAPAVRGIAHPSRVDGGAFPRSPAVWSHPSPAPSTRGTFRYGGGPAEGGGTSAARSVPPRTAAADLGVLRLRRAIDEGCTPSSLTWHTAISPVVPAAMSVTTEGVGTGSVGWVTRLGCRMWRPVYGTVIQLARRWSGGFRG